MALTTMASVMAICSATRMAPARLRISAERMGRISMSLHLQVGSWRRASDAPRGVEAGQNSGEHRDADHDDEVHLVDRQMPRRVIAETRVPGSQRPDSAEAEQSTDDAAGEGHESRLGQVLPENIP